MSVSSCPLTVVALVIPHLVQPLIRLLWNLCFVASSTWKNCIEIVSAVWNPQGIGDGAHEMMSITDFIAVDGSSSSSSAGLEEEELDSGTIKRISTLIQSEYEAQAVRVSSTAKKSGMKKKTKI